ARGVAGRQARVAGAVGPSVAAHLGRPVPAGGTRVSRPGRKPRHVATALVVENDPDDDARRLGQWLREAGLRLDTVRPHAGEPLPHDLDGYAALVVLGGGQHAYEVPRGGPATGGDPAGGGDA